MAADALAAVLLGTYWARQGTRVLLVYSRSSHWRSYIEAARLAGQAVVINWPDRATWPDRTVEIRVFLHGSGEETFQPMAILLPRRGRVRTVDFGQAFRDFRHDRPAALRRAEARLLGFLDAEVAT